MTDEKTSIIAVDIAGLAVIAGQWTEMLAAAQQLPCDTADQRAWWAEWLDKAHHAGKALEEERQELVRPLIDDKARVDAVFKAASAPALQMKDLAKSKIAAYEEAFQARQTALLLAARTAVAAGDTDAAQTALGALGEVSETNGASVAWEWVPTIVNALEVPREWCEPSVGLFKQHCKQHAKSDVIPPVPGIKFERRAVISKRGGTK